MLTTSTPKPKVVTDQVELGFLACLPGIPLELEAQIEKNNQIRKQHFQSLSNSTSQEERQSFALFANPTGE